MRFSLPAFFICLLCLAGCSTEKVPTEYIFNPPASNGGQLCTGQCGQARDACMNNCSLKNRECTVRVQGQAISDYEKYRQQEDGKPEEDLELRPKDFERLKPCESVFDSCKQSCETPYRACYGSCGGKVDIARECTLFCF